MATTLWILAIAIGWAGIATAVAAGISRGDHRLYSRAAPRHHRVLLAVTIGLGAASTALIITAAALHQST